MITKGSIPKDHFAKGNIAKGRYRKRMRRKSQFSLSIDSRLAVGLFLLVRYGQGVLVILSHDSVMVRHIWGFAEIDSSCFRHGSVSTSLPNLGN